MQTKRLDTYQNSLAAAAGAVLTKRAVQFGDPRAYLREKAYGKVLPFIQYPWVEQTGDGTTSPTQTQATGPDGILLSATANSRIDFQIPVGTAGVFHMLYIKLHVRTVYDGGNNNFGSMSFLAGQQTSMQAGASYFDATWNQQVFYHQMVGVSAYVNSGAGRNLLGGLQKLADDTGFDEVPINSGAMQDYQDGLLTLRTPYQVPAGGTVKISVKNQGLNAVYNTYVNGAIMGYCIVA